MRSRRKKVREASGPAAVSTEDRVSNRYDRWAVAGVCLFLAVATWIVFGQTRHHGFLHFDTEIYVSENSTVTAGLTWDGIVTAFTRSRAANWYPLTAISHMLDCELFGRNAGAHHLTNVLLHTLTAILLFLVLRKMTAALWRSAFVAAVFAIHPLRVESVAWVAERKDVLSGLFFVLTLAAYVRHARSPRSLIRYLPVFFLFASGLMSKPMLVTLPFVLFLLDYWPLRRLELARPDHRQILQQLIIEKIPLLVLSAARCVVTILVQQEAIQTVAVVPFSLRIGNAIVSYIVYLGQLFLPVNLAVYYPFPADGFPLWLIIPALLVLITISVVAIRQRNERPYFLVGWFWYLGMLVPVIGLVQAGAQARADRYTYLPHIGACILFTWLIAEATASWRHRRLLLGCGAAIILTALTVAARVQTTYWRDSESLWTRALACTSDNALAENNLANALLDEGRWDEAVAHCLTALKLDPGYGDAHNCLGLALLQKGLVDEAIAQFEEAVKAEPSSANVHNNFGTALLRAGHPNQAIAQFQRALATAPDLDEAHNNLGLTLLRMGRTEEAVAHYRRAIELKPDSASACNNLAWVLATSPDPSVRNGEQAVVLARKAREIAGDGNIVILRTLAAAYAEAGHFPEAIEAAEQTRQLAAPQANAALNTLLQGEINLYQSGQPLRETAPAP